MSKKIIIPRADIPNATDSTFYIRFRIVSEDRNRLSAWTPIYEVSSTFVYTGQGVSDIGNIYAMAVVL